MTHSRYQKFRWLGLLTVGFLMSAPVASAQSCGDFIYIDVLNGSDEYIQEIDDCDNPFDLFENPDISAQLTYSYQGESIEDGDTIVVEELPTDAAINVTVLSTSSDLP